MTEQKFNELRTRARGLIDTDALSRHAPSSVVGDGVPNQIKCSLCGEFIKKPELKYLVRAEGKGLNDQHYTMHFLCFAAWHFEVSAVK
jgi:hypothetical protein